MKRFMSITNLTSLFDITDSQALMIRGLIKDKFAVEDTELWRIALPKTFTWIDSCYHNPLYNHCRDEVTIEAINEILGGYGIESIRKESNWVSHYWQDTHFLYVNMGNTYNATILYDTRKDRYIVSDYGTIMETNNL